MSSADAKPLPFVYQFAAGAVAGVSETGKAVGDEGYNGMVDCFRKIIKNEGYSYHTSAVPIGEANVWQFFKTVPWYLGSHSHGGAKEVRDLPMQFFSRLTQPRATKFAANDSWGAFYRNLFGQNKMNQSLSILTGATAGATESFVVVPFELVKIRLQDKAQAHKYTGMTDCVMKIIKQEGPLTLYQGLESTMWRHILWNAGYFGCIFQVRALLPKAADKKGQITNDLLSGAIGGTVGTILNTPMDVVKSRIQNSPKVAGSVPKYNWAWPALGTVMREEGFPALYKGFLPKVLRLGPGGGILLVVFTGVMDFFRTMRDGK
ncbi:Mitochondrial 2-oxodicarboxylate carrier 2 [Curvularia clavata]|uniref:Mitochondrial 2-oxodicarboxylate carrier 2 n=1 Tax=Curvularia clavata TaxID=95742 RepID=A0A9Q8Z1E6_CURCL|nr:Mitochondrial 2-oxodicarboxylate carrier 2 [Curvularia clavata]